MDNRLIVTLDEVQIQKGTGAPSGTPSRAGLRYLDTSTGVLYFSRNVLNFNGSGVVIPSITNARKVSVRFWHNEPSPPALRQLWDGLGSQTRARREATTGNISGVASGLILVLDGALITNNTVNPSEGVWHAYQQTDNADRQFSFIGRNNTNGFFWFGRIADVWVFDSSDVLLASYAIDEGSGTTIIDSVSGRNGTLTLGSGSWILDWVPL